MRHAERSLRLVMPLLVAAGWLVPLGTAMGAPVQRRAEPAPRTGRAGETGRCGPSEPRSAGRGKPGRGGRALAREELHALFRPAPEDFGPLQPGEEAELRALVEERWPRLYRVLRDLERRRPEVYRQKMKRLLPRLRHLRRLQEENPEMAELVGHYGENLFNIELLRRAWEHSPAVGRTPIERRIRRAVADNIQLQVQALRLWADQLEQAREAHVAASLEALTRPDADLSGESPEVRERILAYRSLGTEAERSAAQQKLRAELGAELDHRIAAIRQRARQMEANAPREVDRRVQRILEGRRPGPGGGPPP